MLLYGEDFFTKHQNRQYKKRDKGQTHKLGTQESNSSSYRRLETALKKPATPKKPVTKPVQQREAHEMRANAMKEARRL
jgi:hypothetical protein